MPCRAVWRCPAEQYGDVLQSSVGRVNIEQYGDGHIEQYGDVMESSIGMLCRAV